MSMQDKEIDQLFRSELYDHAVEPGNLVWSNVSTALNNKRSKKTYSFYLRIAASVLILLVAGIYFIPRVKVKGSKPLKTAFAKNNTVKKVIIAADSKPEIIDNDNRTKKYTASLIKIKASNRIKTSISEDKVVQQQVPKVLAEERSNEVLVAVVPDTETPFSTKPEVDEEVIFKTTANLTASLPVQTSKPLANAIRRRRINSLGDLINVVVSKVDKRKDKIIEFTNKEGDEATVTGINLGFIKIKKQD
jgi:hypothetical protein